MVMSRREFAKVSAAAVATAAVSHQIAERTLPAEAAKLDPVPDLLYCGPVPVPADWLRARGVTKASRLVFKMQTVGPAFPAAVGAAGYTRLVGRLCRWDELQFGDWVYMQDVDDDLRPSLCEVWYAMTVRDAYIVADPAKTWSWTPDKV